MPSRYHETVKNSIVRFGNSNNKVDRVRQSGHPLHINHPTRRLSILYNPDVHFEMRNRKIIVFEVLDSQQEVKTIADIIRSLLAMHVSQVYFFVDSIEKRDEVYDLCDVILSKLADDFKTKKSDLPLDAKIVLITRSETNNQTVLDSVISEEIKI